MHPLSDRRHVLLKTAASLTGSAALVLFVFSVAFASEGADGELRSKLMNFAWKFIDFVVLFGLLYWWIGKKVKDFFSGRREGVGKSLDAAERTREEAREKYQEYSLKLEKANAEIEALTKMIREQGAAEREKILEEARIMAEKIKEDARARMEQEFNKATHRLRLEAAELSTRMAESLLREKIKKEDHEAIVRDYIKDLTLH
jgi:F-type H+-transporting ATPase subunit b